ncbi:MAG: Heat-inducible transcription repressor HrcA [Alphaproteobacteria bacterium MarineAlpha3_Bin5]|nr:heat-inducible transcriptional repressor HrcA [Magnetovibrio sp.]PPR77745.1 MAG: Heat-inducible transcription repressor HrcA [Alphaproteobacteria bacterium MarineAlpha3_Bin5]
MSVINRMNARSCEILGLIIDRYIETGEPVGSREISKKFSKPLSPATIRNAMADLVDAGLLYAPHISSGRLPTDAGLRLFVDGILELGNLTPKEQKQIDAQCAGSSNNREALLEEATRTLSGLSGMASLVVVPKTESPLKHIEFVALSPGRTLVVLVTESGSIENRIIQTPTGISPSILVQATNYLSARLVGQNISEVSGEIMNELNLHKAELDDLTKKVVSSGLATWSGDEGEHGSLIIRGQANLLEDVHAITNLEQIRALFDVLETKEEMLRILSMVDEAEGVQIFIGAENSLFNLAGCSLIIGPYRGKEHEVVGAIGVIGPARVNYARIIPLVDYTAKLMGRLIEKAGKT